MDIERKASQNINEDKSKLPFAITDLEGLSQEQLDKLEKVEGKEETHRYISTKYPEIIPAMRLVKSGEVRKALSLMKGTVCMAENEPLLQELVDKRQQLAELLGYKSFSAYILETRMAKKPMNV